MIVTESITLRWLKKKKACDEEAIKIFEERFGKKATIKQIVDYLHKINRPDWEAWLIVQEIKLTIAMINNGADIHVNDDCALRCAAHDGHLDLVRFLIEKGADIHARDDFVQQCLAMQGHLDILKVLKNAG